MVSMTVSPGGEGLLGRLERAVSALAAVPVGLRPGDAGDRIRGLHRLRARLDAELLAELAAFETSGGHQQAGCATVGSWVRLHLRQTPTGAGGLVGVARALGGLPLVADALAAGRISREHVDAIVAGARRIGTDRMARHEQTLVDLATAASAGEVRAAVAEIVRLAEADTETGDTAEERAAAAEASRSFESRRVGDQLVVNAAVDLATGEALTGYIDAHSTPRPGPDGGGGGGGRGGRDERTATQRRADAFCRLVDTATDAADLPERVRSKAAVTLTVSLETLLGLPGAGPLLDRLGVTPAETARRLLCDGTLTRIVLDPAGEPIDINTRVRSHSTAQAKALAVRHTRCAFPGCPVCRSGCATCTTSTTGPTADPPPWPTWSRCAAPTTGTTTKAATPSPPAPDECSVSTTPTDGPSLTRHRPPRPPPDSSPSTPTTAHAAAPADRPG